MSNPSQSPSPESQTLFQFGFDVDQQKYDSRFYSPSFTKGIISLEEVDIFLNVMNNLVPTGKVISKAFWCKLLPLHIGYLILVPLAATYLEMDPQAFVFFYLALMIPYLIIGVIFMRKFKAKRIKDMQIALEPYNQKMEGSGLKLYVDPVHISGFKLNLDPANASGCPLIEIRSDMQNRSLRYGADEPAANIGSFLLHINPKGEIQESKSKTTSSYTPQLTDGRLTVGEFQDIMGRIGVIYVETETKARKAFAVSIIFYFIGLGSNIVLFFGEAFEDVSIMLTASICIYIGYIVCGILVCYGLRKKKEKKRRMLELIDSLNESDIERGLRWAYPHTGQGIHLWKHYKALELISAEDIQYDAQENNEAPAPKIHNGYNILVEK